MTSTIESINMKIMNKCDYLNRIIETFNQNNLSAAKYEMESQKISQDYRLNTINILTNYHVFSQKNNKNSREIVRKRDEFLGNYIYILKKDNIIGRLNSLKSRVYHFLKIVKDDNKRQHIWDKTRLYFQRFDNNVVMYDNTSISYELCKKCGTKMEINNLSSELVCMSCGRIIKLVGTILDENMSINHENNKGKHGAYDPSKHCRFWLDRIQARETTDIPDKILRAIKKCIIRDNIKNWEEINCYQIRKYLRETRNSKYNEHTSLIRKLITGIVPPQLTDKELHLIHVYFNQVIRIFEDIKPPTKTNCPFHPYFIRKIISQVLTSPKDQDRKKNIFACIHLQSRETLIENDRLWKKICDRIPNFIYYPTDRNMKL